jgi:hypothetical protein
VGDYSSKRIWQVVPTSLTPLWSLLLRCRRKSSWACWQIWLASIVPPLASQPLFAVVNGSRTNSKSKSLAPTSRNKTQPFLQRPSRSFEIRVQLGVDPYDWEFACGSASNVPRLRPCLVGFPFKVLFGQCKEKIAQEAELGQSKNGTGQKSERKAIYCVILCFQTQTESKNSQIRFRRFSDNATVWRGANRIFIWWVFLFFGGGGGRWPRLHSRPGASRS